MTEAQCRRTCDIISNLPDDVIDVILMCFPLRDVVSTGILSRKWLYKLAKFQKLPLDQTLLEDISICKVKAKLDVILFHLFSLLQGPISECGISNITNLKHFS